MKYYYSLLRRRTRSARWGMILAAIAVILIGTVLLPLTQPSRAQELLDGTEGFLVAAAQFVLVVAFCLELFRSLPFAWDDRFGHLLPEPERQPLLAVLLSVLFSALLYTLSAVFCAMLAELLRIGNVTQIVHRLTENLPLYLLVFLPAALVQLFFTITLVMCLQLLFHRLGQKHTLGGRIPHSAGRLLTFLLILGLWLLCFEVAMKVISRWPLMLDVASGTVRSSAMVAEAYSFGGGDLFLWSVSLTENAQTVLSVPVLAGLIVLSALQWVFAVILAEDRLDWEV